MKYWIYLAALILFVQKTTAQPAEYRHKAALDSLIFTKKYRPEDPGFSVVVIEKGRIVYERQTGMANLKKSLPITSATMFNIGSVTKQFTAACILLLEERGKLRCSDPVQKYLPELPDFGKTVTLEHLLAHTSGIPDHFEILVMQSKPGEKWTSPEAAIRWVQKAPMLSFAPGSDFAYSNTGYMLLAAVVERVSEQKIGEFAAENIFRPLGMGHTNFAQFEKDGLPDGTTSYVFNQKKAKFGHQKPTPNAIGATGVQSTLRDMAFWDANFYQNKIGDGSLIKAMETPHFLNYGGATNYGCGLFLQKWFGHRSVAHTGGWSSFLMDCRRFPDQQVSVLVVSNNDFCLPFPIADEICWAIMFFPPTIKFDKHTTDLSGLPLDARKLEGTFISQSNFIRRVRLEGGELSINIPSGAGEKKLLLRFLEPPSDSLLLFEDERGDTASFRLDGRQNLLGFWWEGGHFTKVQRFYEKLGAPATAAEARLFCGKYASKSPKQHLKIKQGRRTGGLVLKPIFFLKYPLEAVGGGVFLVKGEKVVLRFAQDGLLLGNDWVSNLPMKKKK